MTITLEEAIESFRRRFEEQLKTFESNWRQNRNRDPEYFSASMTKEDWDEQFAIFLENNS